MLFHDVLVCCRCDAKRGNPHCLFMRGIVLLQDIDSRIHRGQTAFVGMYVLVGIRRRSRVVKETKRPPRRLEGYLRMHFFMFQIAALREFPALLAAGREIKGHSDDPVFLQRFPSFIRYRAQLHPSVPSFPIFRGVIADRCPYMLCTGIHVREKGLISPPPHILCLNNSPPVAVGATTHRVGFERIGIQGRPLCFLCLPCFRHSTRGHALKHQLMLTE